MIKCGSSATNKGTTRTGFYISRGLSTKSPFSLTRLVYLEMVTIIDSRELHNESVLEMRKNKYKRKKTKKPTFFSFYMRQEHHTKIYFIPTLVHQRYVNLYCSTRRNKRRFYFVKWNYFRSISFWSLPWMWDGNSGCAGYVWAIYAADTLPVYNKSFTKQIGKFESCSIV